MRSAIKNYMAMIAVAVVAVLVLGAIGVRIDRNQEPNPVEGIEATPAIAGNAPAGLVDAQWLLQYGTQVDYILDLGDIRQYDLGHIPDAHHIWWQDAMRIHAANYSEPDQISREPGTTDSFGFLNLHIPQDARVVIYDSNQSERATWLMWVMRLNGFTDVHVLDGGLAAWIGAGGEITAEPAPSIDTSVRATPTWDETSATNTEDILASLDDPDFQIIDTRDTAQRSDTVNGTAREGRIPGAVNIETRMVLRPDGTFRSPEELQEIFASAGISQENTVVVYSLFAHQSGTVWLALQLAGFDNVHIYQQGYVAWGYDANLPIETGPFPTQEPVATPSVVATPETLASPAATPTEGPTDLTDD